MFGIGESMSPKPLLQLTTERRLGESQISGKRGVESSNGR